MAKKTLEQAKLEMDKRASELRAIISRPDFTKKEIYTLQQNLANLYQFESLSRSYEPIKYEEGETTPEYLEQQIEQKKHELALQLDQAAQAQFELKETASFYRAYNIVIHKGKIIKLEQDLEDAKNWAYQWREEIEKLISDPNKSIDEKLQERAMLMQNYNKALQDIELIERQLVEQKSRMIK